jgi:hypothetical protein
VLSIASGRESEHVRAWDGLPRGDARSKSPYTRRSAEQGEEDGLGDVSDPPAPDEVSLARREQGNLPSISFTGATAFTYLRFRVRPRRGGEAVLRSRHCPRREPERRLSEGSRISQEGSNAVFAIVPLWQIWPRGDECGLPRRVPFPVAVQGGRR